MQILKTLFHRTASPAQDAPAPVSSAVASNIEPLEHRLLLAAGPRITDVFADNRGQVLLTLNDKLAPASISSKSVQVTAKGDKQPAKVSYSAKKNQITVTANLKPNTPYTIRLLSKKIKDKDGNRLDGEFRGAGKTSGNGKAGGDFIATTKRARNNVARFSTTYGNIDVRLFDKQTPLTVKNFVKYANARAYDNTFFHRSMADFVIQAGGFKLNSKKNEIAEIKQNKPVKNEPHPGNPGNVRGTIAMAKLGGDPDSATNQWFFNLADNRENLDNQNGGFTAFGQITDNAGLKVMRKIAAREKVNAGGAFSDLPLRDADAALERGELNPNKDLILVSRIALQMDLAKG